MFFRNVMHLCLIGAGAAILSGCEDIEGYIQDLKSADTETRQQAAAKLQELGPEADEAIPALIQATGDQDPEVRRFAVEALGAIGESNTEVTEALIRGIDDDNVHVRRASVVAVGKLDRFPAAALPALLDHLGDEDELVRQFSMSTFEELGSLSVRTLTRALDDPDATIRKSAVTVMHRLGGDARAAQSALKRVAQFDSNEEISQMAQKALMQIERARN